MEIAQDRPFNVGGVVPATSSSRISKAWFQFLLPIELPVAVELAEEYGDGSPVKATGPAGAGFGLLSAVCPPELIDRVLEECGRRERRVRLLPARLVVYVLLVMCLHPELGYQRLLHQVGGAAPEGWRIPNKSSFIRARQRLGGAVMEQLFRNLARPLAEERDAGCWWRGRRLMAIDGSTLSLAASEENEAYFEGQVAIGEARQGPPRARVMALIECGTRALVDVVFDRYKDSEQDLVARLLSSVTPDMLVLADRNFLGSRLWKRFVEERRADVVWRVPAQMAKKVRGRLDDGTYLSVIGAGRSRKPNPITVRIIEYTIDGSRTVYRLATNMLDPELAPALELAGLYAERWEAEACYEELKITQCGLRRLRSLRSESLEGVAQEFWANCALYQLSRDLVHRSAAMTPERDCDRISFSLVQDILRRGTQQAWSKTRRVGTLIARAAWELATPHNLLTRRDRSYPRALKTGTRRYPVRHPALYPYFDARLPRRPQPLILA